MAFPTQAFTLHIRDRTTWHHVIVLHHSQTSFFPSFGFEHGLQSSAAMMLSVPSARRYLAPALTILALLILIRLLSQRALIRSSQTALQGVLQSYVARNAQVVVVVNASTHPRLIVADSSAPSLHRQAATIPRQQDIPLANPLMAQFTQCPIQPNPHTSHIRLPNVLYNVSLVAPALSSPEHQKREKNSGDDAEGKETISFFNPAVIALPHWSGRAKYVLVARLVTSGFHQESHICLADICHPPQSSPVSFPLQRSKNATFPPFGPDADPATHLEGRQPRSRQALPPAASPCSPSDLSDTRLGGSGGLRCLNEPVKINIPSTPAENCTDSWLAFPDIPGFHDPRVFWSGKGEPLILVNSASRYGCVGLWVVDLRKVYPQLERVLSRDHHHKAIGVGVDGHGAKGVKARDMKPGSQVGEDQRRTGIHRGLGVKPVMSYPHLTEITRNPRESRARVEKNWMLWFPSADDAYVQYDLIGQGPGEADGETALENEIETLARLGLNATNSLISAIATNHTAAATQQHHVKRDRWTEGRQIKRGRTFAKLTGNGFTTPNLTSTFERSCFSQSEGHFRDSLGNRGHWHQGSNSLRLILCTRAQARSDSACTDDDNANGTAVTTGRSVHFAIMHRKFSNELELPLRYERYVVVWEGREPFQLLGVSRFPLLMKNEKAGPWTEEENWPHPRDRGWNATQEHLHEKEESVVRRGDEEPYANEAEQEDDFFKSQAYFTYTPSLAWAWRPHSAAANQEQEDDDVEYLSQLGTGYLGDDVLVGIGLEDLNQAFARVKVEDLLQCLRLCPGVKFADKAS
ncbi:hypothetical protein AYL99_03407 [Fonsecaea erecta]|uniref:Uncharacterized protein n=1 Tax=Fonsecaea erecta TaxID=1367422 RepID=A0A178ZPA0_9EURO|nr:hypothetical protein AYL99_03407 [Fonsecaea erecta]OAP61206.1 hypothetical protein AYL99_03407 [Fonsecaea erecta]